MAQKTYAIMGASGQIGHIIVEKLLEYGHKVKAIARDMKKLDRFKSKEAELISIEKFDDKEALTKAFKGVDGVFALIPPGFSEDNYSAFQDHVGEAIKTALERNAIKYLVFLSSIGAELSNGTGPIKGLHRQEERFNTIRNLNIIHLRPCFFMENLLKTIPGIQQTGTFKIPLLPELAFPMVSTDDIGLKAAELLNQLNFKGQMVFDLAGPRDKSLSLQEIVAILGNAINMPDLEIAHQTYEQVKQDLLAAGASPSMTDLYIEMYKAFNEKKIAFTQKITLEHRGKTTVEKFGEKFAKEYNQKRQKVRT